jgi:5'-AMP-activated protein kinase regulatory beta subunit
VYINYVKPTTNDRFGGRNNVVSIKKSDFEVMSALNSDDTRLAQPILSPSSTEGSYGQLIPSHHTPMVLKGTAVHSSVPPAVPPQLLNVNLNKRVPNVNEPSLLTVPNHVSVNHMYALSIKVCSLIYS